MKEKKFLKQIISIYILMIILIISNIGKVDAVLQANKRVQYTKVDTPSNWMANFRNMEKSGEAMGLNETLNEDLTASSESNNIDVHMMKTTEYGAIAILSASGYGNPSNEQEITSTTGNNTGMILNTNRFEMIAGGAENKIFLGVEGRYYSTYTFDRESARVGDALGNATTKNPGCAGWHKGTFNWITNNYEYIYFNRSTGGVFSWQYNNASALESSRGIIVCGIGI